MALAFLLGKKSGRPVHLPLAADRSDDAREHGGLTAAVPGQQAAAADPDVFILLVQDLVFYIVDIRISRQHLIDRVIITLLVLLMYKFPPKEV